MQVIGSKADVFNGIATRTSGNLTREDLMINRRNKIVSRKAYQAALNRYESRKKDLINSAREGKRRSCTAPISSYINLHQPFCGVVNAKNASCKVLSNEQRLKMIKARLENIF
jgi:Na+-transporting NADH:ubiquinone oxidoreductase subunit NqrF